MNRIENTFNNKQAFVGYLTAGQGGLQRTVDAAVALVDGGVNILEIGVPFTDPIADGPVIQEAMQDALKRGVTFQQVLEVVSKIRKKTDVPIVLFSYANPLLSAGLLFPEQAREAGCDAILLIDMPVEDPFGIAEACQKASLNQILVVSPSSSEKRLEELAQYTGGFIYYACRKGVTGVRAGLSDDFYTKIPSLKKTLSSPVVAGFGIADKKSAGEVLKHADGFVVGSLFIQAIARGESCKELTRLAKQIDPRRSLYGV